MSDKRIRSYWLILLALLMAANMVLSVQQTQAHYVNTTIWNTVFEADGNAFASNCLSGVSDAPVTVLLGEMNGKKRTVSFTLASSKDTTGNLTWSVDKSDYVKVGMDIDGMTVSDGAAVELTAGNTAIVNMTLSLTEMAMTTVHEEMDVYVTVTWGEHLGGTFWLTLPEMSEEELPTEPTEATEPESTEGTDPTETTDPTEATGPAPTEAAEPVMEEPTDPPATEPMAPVHEDEDGTEPPAETVAQAEDVSELEAVSEGKKYREEKETVFGNYLSENQEGNETQTGQGEPAVTNPPATNPPATEPPATNPPATNPPATEPPATNPPATNPPATEPPATNPPATEPPATNPPATEPPATEPPATEPPATEPPATEPPATEPPSGTEIRMETIGVFVLDQKLPVSISLMGDITQVRLGMGTVADEGIQINPFPAFTCYSLDNGASYYLMYHSDTIEIDPQGSAQLPLLLDFSRAEVVEDTDLVLAAEGYAGQSLIGSVNANVKTAVDTLYQKDAQFLTRDAVVQIALTDKWKEYEFDYSVEILTTVAATDANPAETGYIAVDASTWSEFVSDDENYMLRFRIGETLPQAGTYRVTMNWSYQGICFAEEQTTFFINYSVYSESERTGGTEQ